MANIDLTKYGISGTTEIVYNPSYELLFEEETKSTNEGYEVGQNTELDTVNVMTGLTASQSIEKVDKAINRASSVRSKIGSYQNRFEHTQNNIAVSNENLTSALSAMTDTDMAEEMTEYTSVNVMTQAATSILAQANERPSTVLQILQ